MVEILSIILLSSAFVFCIVGLIYMNRELYYLDEERIKKAEHQILKKLKNFAEENNIPIDYFQKRNGAAGEFYFSENIYGNILMKKINIYHKYNENVEVLAHELGHYLTTKSNFLDNNERNADNLGADLIKYLATDKEKKFLSMKLDMMRKCSKVPGEKRKK